MKTIVIIAGFIIFLLAVIFARNIILNDFTPNEIQSKENTNQNVELEYQKAVLKLNSYGNYVVEPSVLKKDIPVRMEVDLNSVYGCARSVVIKDFNVMKSVREGDNIIEFIPNKEGRIRIQCSMNMFIGYFDVSSNEVSGNNEKTNTIEQNSLLNSAINTANTQNNEIINSFSRQAGCGCGCGGGLIK